MLFVPALPAAHLQAAARSAAAPPALTQAAPSTGAGPIAGPIQIMGRLPQMPTVRHHERMRISFDRRDAHVGRSATFKGALLPRLRHRRVALQLLEGGRWRTVARSFTGARGRFLLHYHSGAAGSWAAQVRFAGGPYATGVTHRVGMLNFFRPALASWYGGGGGMACGGQLTSATMGVANKTLPCGTWVTLRYGSHSVRVQVVDRGPYVQGREYDLTEATKRALGFEGVGTVWATH